MTRDYFLEDFSECLIEGFCQSICCRIIWSRMTALDFVFVAKPVEFVNPELWFAIMEKSFRYAETTNDVGSQELKD